MLRQQYINIQESKVGLLPRHTYKSNSKCVLELSIKDKTVHLEENTAVNFCDLGLSSGLLRLTLKLKATTA